MTARTNARVAGIAFLVYIAAGITSMAGPPLPLRVVLSLTMALSALALGVTLFAITRAEDVDIARLAMISRIAEGVIGATFIASTLAIRSLADGGAAAGNTLQTIQAFVRTASNQNAVVTGEFFAIGSLLFSWLLLKGHFIPALLAWVGVAASALLVVCLPLQLGAVLAGPITVYIWVPMLVFEVPLAGWLIVKGVEIRNS